MIGIGRIMWCAAGTTLLFDGTRYRAQIIGLLPAGPSFALLFSRERAERKSARVCMHHVLVEFHFFDTAGGVNS